MDNNENINQEKELLGIITEDITENNIQDIKEKLDEIHPADTANILESMPPEKRKAFWEAIPEQQEGEILTYMRDEARTGIIHKMDESELIAAASSMEANELAEVLEDLPEKITESILSQLDEDHRLRLESVLSYEEETAGRLMNPDVVSVREDVSLAVVLRWLRRHNQLPPHTDSLMIIDEDNHYIGKLDIADVVTGNPEDLVSQVMDSRADTIFDTATYSELASLFERRDLISVAVINNENQLLGRITIDDVVDIIREQADAALLKSAGLKEEQDLFAPILPSAKQRGIWLGINLITVFFAAGVIGLFEKALDEIVALAVLMPIVASMGGIAGSQTLTLTIRGLALQQISHSNIPWLTTKEIAVGTLNGLVWALVVAVAAFLWFENQGIALIIAVAMILNLVVAAMSGVIIPLALERMGIDPALSGAVILTTITDVIGFLSFLGLATLFLL